MKYVLAIDQSTSGTKGTIFSSAGQLVARADLPHRQITNELGWVSHDLEEIYENVLRVAALVVKKAAVSTDDIVTVGLSNQRETVGAWDRQNVRPLANAVVWQCARAAALCKFLDASEQTVRKKTGLTLSPYFSAPKIMWILKNIPEAASSMQKGTLCFGTVDAFLIHRLTGQFKTDYTNASRTGLLNIHTLSWDEDMLCLYGIDRAALPEIVCSDSFFGLTDFGGLFQKPIPLHSVMGDSHAALYANGCIHSGMGKVTFGTGSSVMVNIGDIPIIASQGAVTSVAFGLRGKASYALEGNINYTGSVIKWLVDDLGLLQTSREAGALAASVDNNGGVYLVPAFSGLGSPYWCNDARAVICGMNRSTQKAHIVRAAEECIAYQIRDVVDAVNESSSIKLTAIYGDGGPTKDAFLMQFVADILGIPVIISDMEELSAAGVAYMAAAAVQGADVGEIIAKRKTKQFDPKMSETERALLYDGWKKAVQLLVNNRS